MRQYKDELAVAAYLSNLNLEFSLQIRRQILGVDTVPDLQTTFSRVLRISTATLAPMLDQSAMAASRSRGRGLAKGGGRGGHTDSGGRPRYQHCRWIGHRSNRSWDKFGKLQWANAITEITPATPTDE